MISWDLITDSKEKIQAIHRRQFITEVSNTPQHDSLNPNTSNICNIRYNGNKELRHTVKKGPIAKQWRTPGCAKNYTYVKKELQSIISLKPFHGNLSWKTTLHSRILWVVFLRYPVLTAVTSQDRFHGIVSGHQKPHMLQTSTTQSRSRFSDEMVILCSKVPARCRWWLLCTKINNINAVMLCTGTKTMYIVAPASNSPRQVWCCQ